MGTDAVMMMETSHGGKPWHPVAGEELAFQIPRNNVMFSMLADVGNRSGRWEPRYQEPRTVETDDGTMVNIPAWWYDPDDGGHDRLEPVAEPKGVPDDASIAWLANVAMWEAQREMVVTTYLTPEEILEADWDQVVHRQGIVTEEDYLLYREKGALPERWAGAAGGEGTATVTAEEYDAGKRGQHSTAVQLSWVAGTAREVCKDFLDMVQDMVTIGSVKPDSRLRFMLLFEC